MLELRFLGKTGLRVTPIGLGGAWLGRTGRAFDERLAVATVLRALELGIRLIDTSPLYLWGKSEVAVGLALDEWLRSGGRRHEIVLSTKTGTRTTPKDYSAEGTRQSVEESLRLLGTDYLDVVHVHDPDDLGPVLAPDGALAALQQMKAEGTVRAIGLGVRRHDFHRRCIETGAFDVVLTYRDYNLLDQSAAQDILPLASRQGVGVFNGTPIIGGLLAGGDPSDVARERGVSASRHPGHAYSLSTEHICLARRLWQWGNGKGIGLLALNLQFCLRERRIASTLVGASTPEQVEADLAAVKQPIAEQVWAELHQDFALPA